MIDKYNTNVGTAARASNIFNAYFSNPLNRS